MSPLPTAQPQAQHGGKHSESHQNPSVCQLFIKGGGERQCKWGELCNQAHPHRDWLNQRHDMSVKYVHQCKQEFEMADESTSWDALDPDTNERVTIPKRYLKFTRGLYAKEYAGNRLASICMLFLKRYDGVMDGCGCTAGDLCNQVHVELEWIINTRVKCRKVIGDYDDTKHNPNRYQGIHFPAGRRTPKWPNARTPPNSNLKPVRYGTSPESSASSIAMTSPGLYPSSVVTPDQTPPVLPLIPGQDLPISPWLVANQVNQVNSVKMSVPADESSVMPKLDEPERNVTDWFPQGMLVPIVSSQPEQEKEEQAPEQPEELKEEEVVVAVVAAVAVVEPVEAKQEERKVAPKIYDDDDDDEDEESEEEEVLQHLNLIDDDESDAECNNNDDPGTPTFKAYVATDSGTQNQQDSNAHSPIHCGRAQSGQIDTNFSPFGFESLTALMANLEKPDE
eukprot:TRINITY_DN1695_c0_g2_i2.p1 TRINITY_DN1695_c0_g2~~TRINITY_DN1695_c0_g2_i2.p1  ORF type:complete len:451 (+),score=148.05 TRINITY_DN1695_c0_g2_i2:738-2090(+)